VRDCCKVPEPVVAADDRCRQCGGKGRLVLRETMESLLKPEALGRLADEPYSFDRSPDCDVVYYSNEAGSYFLKDDLTVRVGMKETKSPIFLCYCFGHTEESVRDEFATTGRSTVAESINAEVQAGNCACDVKNPSGNCCLGDVNRAVLRMQQRVREEKPVAHMERG